ncbi:MAG TPA: aminotransferase class I/II-fold pyridoxal phosphate-dependent enzyme [Candidatus Acidoferrales bacterium]|nr:aminotransferase class I/II-fold pyridoxal phosphate-dependent enzyme [Candidatus Acidoferrales bacterium]
MPKQQDNLRVPYGLAVHGKEEEERVLAVLREHRTIMGKETAEFEKKVASLFGKSIGITVNSGSSANLLAIEILNIQKGSEVITPILTFSTTVAPLIMKDLIPVFVDVEKGSYILNLDQVEKAITTKTRALMIPFLLGNVPDLVRIKKIAKKHNLFVILDSCDTLGATFNKKKVGEFGDICTTSFYGSHIITAGGNGGMLLVDSQKYADKAKTLRGWGRGSALIGETEDIGSRYKTKIGQLPYDAKFIFTDIGYNFLPMEIGSAFGNAQLKKLNKFKKIRETNFKKLHSFFKKYENLFILPEQDPLVQTQWLAFPLTIKKLAPFSRVDLLTFLEKNNIQTRPIFTGVITKQPGFSNIKHKTFLKSFPMTEEVMERGFLIGCHQGLEEKHLKKIEDTFNKFIKIYK